MKKNAFLSSGWRLGVAWLLTLFLLSSFSVVQERTAPNEGASLYTVSTTSIDDLLFTYDAGVASGMIIAVNQGQLLNMRNALVEASTYYKEGDYSMTCQCLYWFYFRSFSPRRPTSLIFGPGVASLHMMVGSVINEMGC